MKAEGAHRSKDFMILEFHKRKNCNTRSVCYRKGRRKKELLPVTQLREYSSYLQQT